MTTPRAIAAASRADRSDWVWSAEQTHEAIISPEVFAKAQAQMAAGAYRSTTGKTRTTKRT